MLSVNSNVLLNFINLPKNTSKKSTEEKKVPIERSATLSWFWDNKEPIELLHKCGEQFNKITQEVDDFKTQVQCEEEKNIVNLWEQVKYFMPNAIVNLENGLIPNIYTMNECIFAHNSNGDIIVLKKFQTEFTKEYNKIFSDICSYIKIHQKYCPVYDFFAYCIYLQIMEKDLFYKLMPYLAVPGNMCYPMKSQLIYDNTHTSECNVLKCSYMPPPIYSNDEYYHIPILMKNDTKYNYLPTPYGHKILLIDKPVIKIGNDYFDYNLSFFGKYCNINITIKECELFKKFINLYTKLLTERLNNVNIKEITSKNPFSYYYKGNIHTLSAHDDTPLFKTILGTSEDFSPNFKPNDIGSNLPNALNGLKDYVPKNLLDCFSFLASQDENVIDRIAVLIANCLMAYPLSKKIFVIKTNDDEAAKKLKSFISNLISSNNRRYSTTETRNIEILENYSINNFCSYETFEEIHSLRYANIKAIFIDRNNRKINSSEYSTLINMATHTSSNQSSKQINNIQIILFQENFSISDLRSDDIITIDFSNVNLDNCFENIPDMDFVWAKIYLALYGYRIIKKINKPKKENIKVDLSSDARQEKIKEIIEEFLKECCVSPAEAKKRRDARKNKAKLLKRQNISKDEIAKKVSDTPLYATYRDEFIKYINDYIYLKYSEFGITADEIFTFFRNDEYYSEIYKYTDINVLYYNHTRGDAFRFLSVKKPWDTLYKELETSYENKFNDYKKNINIKELYEKIKTEIDFSELYTGAYLEIGGSPQ